MFATTHSEDQGGAFLYGDPATPNWVPPVAGEAVVGDLSRVAHAVEPLKADVERISVPMVFVPVEAIENRTEGLDAHLYGGKP
jgi:hypothetical protein